MIWKNPAVHLLHAQLAVVVDCVEIAVDDIAE